MSRYMYLENNLWITFRSQVFWIWNNGNKTWPSNIPDTLIYLFFISVCQVLCLSFKPHFKASVKEIRNIGNTRQCKVPVRNSKLWVLDTSSCYGITKFLKFFYTIFIKMMEIWEKLPKTTGASTHTFKYCGCWSTHSTHTNVDPEIHGKIDFCRETLF